MGRDSFDDDNQKISQTAKVYRKHTKRSALFLPVKTPIPINMIKVAASRNISVIAITEVIGTKGKSNPFG